MAEKVHTAEKTLSQVDVGDDTTLRLRYKAAHAAVLALGLLDDRTEFEEIFCEHHEDILIKKRDGMLIGVQVKTQLERLEPFKAKDKIIIGVIKKFVSLDMQYPGQFAKFVITTNHSFWGDKKNGQNLSYILNLQDSENRIFSVYVKYLEVRINNPGIKREDIIGTLQKIELNDDLPKLQNYVRALNSQLAEFERFQHKSYPELTKISKALISFLHEASSKNIESSLRSYFAYLANPTESVLSATIENKRITIEKLQQKLDEFDKGIVYLTTWDDDQLINFPRSYRKLEVKMSAGNICIQDVNLTKDQKASTELLLLRWLNKYDKKVADQRYRHIKTLVRTQCQESYTENKKEDDFFGEDMLIDVRRRLNETHRINKDEIFNIRYEQLFGFVGLLTEECKVWWSRQFDIQGIEY